MKVRIVLSLIVALAITIPVMADERSGPVGRMAISSAAVEWQSVGNPERLVLTVAMPNGAVVTREFQGSRALFRVQDLAPRVVADGTYVYELRAVPRISDEVRQRLAAARATDDDAVVAKVKAEAGIGEPVVQSGAFSIRNGSFVTDSVEPPAPGGKLPKAAANAAGPPKMTPTPNDVVTADDAIIQGSLCVGLDCVNNESFGFDTIRLKENNTRINFTDTSTSAGFPTNDWEITANDSASGGASYLAFTDITGSKVPFKVTAGAATNSLFVASTGKVGFGTASPVLNLHINATDTPAIRQEQNNGGGFTAQTWDIGANEANWFVRDVTGGSRLPLRIRPGAPTSSVDISASGNVGINTASPTGASLEVSGTGAKFSGTIAAETHTDGNVYAGVLAGTPRVIFGGTTTYEIDNTAGALRFFRPGAISMVLDSSGNVGIGTGSPSAQLAIVNGGSSSTINAGATQFTAVSSRTFKENIEPVKAPNILDKIEAVPVVTYDFKNGGAKNRMGLIAEDFYTVLGRGDDKHIDGQDVQMALWLAVQQLTEKNKELTDRLATLEKQLASQPKSQQ